MTDMRWFLEWILDKLFIMIAGWITYQYVQVYSKLNGTGAQVYDRGLYGRIRYWLHGIFHVLGKIEIRMFRKPSKWRWKKNP